MNLQSDTKDMTVRAIEQSRDQLMIFLQQCRFVQFGSDRHVLDVMFDRREGYQNGFGEGSSVAIVVENNQGRFYRVER